MNTTETIRARILALRDEEYAAFQRRLLPTIAPERIVGVRTPALRALAAQLAPARGSHRPDSGGMAPDLEAWLAGLPHPLFEEQQLHAFLIGRVKDFDQALTLTQRFLPYVDNWATCDQLSPAAFRHDLSGLDRAIAPWLAAEHEYTVRFAIGMRLVHFLAPGAFRPDHLDEVVALCRPEYYIRMMQAWYLATALAKQWDATLPVLASHRLADAWTHNKAIQKAIESYRITPEQKELLKSLRRKARATGRPEGAAH